MEIILASGSPRRKEMMEWLDLDHEIVVSDFDEESIKCDDAVELVEELAFQKALVVAQRHPEAIVIGADTMVVLDGEIIGKATTPEEAETIIRTLAGTSHRIVTGVAVLDGLSGAKLIESEESLVVSRIPTDKEIKEYIQSYDWEGKAGAYAVQENPMSFVLETEGSYTNIMGLPLVRLVHMLEEIGVRVPVNPETVIWERLRRRS